MKRIAFISAFFLLVATVLYFTGCTCYCDGESYRGCGYNCRRNCYKYDFSAYQLIATEGTDYSSPKLTYTKNGNSGNVQLEVDIYTDAPCWLTAELVFVQDGTVVGSCSVKQTSQGQKTIVYNQTVRFDQFYDENGGAVECRINHLSVIMEYQ